MENQQQNNLEIKYKKLVLGLAILIPLVVASLFRIEIKGYDFSFLPPIYSFINICIAILLVLAVVSIKNGNKKRHRLLIRFAILGSILFLLGYILYHGSSGDTVFGDLDNNGKLSDQEKQNIGTIRYIYYFILASHIVLSIAVIPMVLLTYLKGWANNLSSHKKLAKYTFPIWLYVSITGPIVYLMIRPFYG